MGEVIKNDTVLYDLNTATIPETSSPGSNNWASIHHLQEPGQKVDSYVVEKQCLSEHSYLEVPETQRDKGYITETDTSFQLETFQNAQIDPRDRKCPTALHLERYNDALNASDLSQSQHSKSPQMSQSNFWFPDSAVTSSTSRISKWSTENLRPITAERQGGTEHDVNQAEPHRDQSDGSANDLCTVENPSPRSDAMEVDTNFAGIRHDRSGADDLIDGNPFGALTRTVDS